MQTPSLIIQNAPPLLYCILAHHLKTLLLLCLACPQTNYSLSALMLLAHLSAPWALGSSCKACTVLEMLSLVCPPLLYEIASIHYKDPVM